jgi:hypothetical protein
MKTFFLRNCRAVLFFLALMMTVGVSPRVWAAAPPAATLIAPTGSLPPSQPTFMWSAEGATWYFLWISKDGSPWYTNWFHTNVYTPTSPLGVGYYQWWVETWNPDGYGPWSAMGAFTVETLCNEAGLRAAVNTGGTYSFSCDGTITLSSPLVVSNNLVLDGAGHTVTISGSTNVRVFQVATGATLTVNHLIIANGKATNGAGIYNDGGTVNLLNSTIDNNIALDTSTYAAHLDGKGAGVYNSLGILIVSNSVFSRNLARGTIPNGDCYPCDGLGGGLYNDKGTVSITASRFEGNVAQGSEGYHLTTGNGSGFHGWGGAIYNAGVLSVSLSTFLTNQAIGGAGIDGAYCSSYCNDGGFGGAARGGAICNVGTCLAYANSFLANGACGGTSGGAVKRSDGVGGYGGNGGQASGGGIYQGSNTLTVIACTFASNYVTGATGSNGASGMYASPGYVGAGGPGGNGGDGIGGGICAVNGAVYMTNNSFAWNRAQGGNGGAGGNYTNFAHSASTGGNGGNGGNAFGGIYVGGATVASVNNTFGWNTGTCGLGAAGGSGNAGNGTNGTSGIVAGGLGRATGDLILANTLIAYCAPSNNLGALADLGHNISSDLSCEFTTPGSHNNVDPALLPLANNGGPTFTMGLLAGSIAINAADESFAPGMDQRGIGRPFGAGSDVGAYEYNLSWGAPFVSSSFTRNPAAAGAPVTLAIRILNTNAAALTSISFTNILPSVMAIAPSPHVTNGCEGIISAVPGSQIFGGSGFSLAAGAECTVSVDAICSTPGEWSSGTLALFSPEIGMTYPASASLRVETIPVAETLAASNALPNSLTLNAQINPDGAGALAFFEWGVTEALGNLTPAQNVGNGFSIASVTITLTNLLPNTAYYYRAVATNAYGASRGIILPASTTGGKVMINDEAALRANMAHGGIITFGIDGSIALSNTLVISQNTILDGSGHAVVLSGNGSVRVMEVNPGVTLALTNIAIADGMSTNGGGIYNQGTLILVGCVVSNNSAVGVAGTAGTNGPSGISSPSPTPGSVGGNGSNGSPAYGGAIFNTGTLNAQNTLFIRNGAQGGAGGNGGNGGDGGALTTDPQCRLGPGRPGGNGGIAGNGGSGFGGAIYNTGTAHLAQLEFASNNVTGGNGGTGGTGGRTPCSGAVSGYGGDAGVGGSASGGAIYNLGLISLSQTTLAQNDSIGGHGGIGGGINIYYGSPGPKIGGPGGNAYGGGIVNAGTNFLVNVSIGLNKATGGNGGLGGSYIDSVHQTCGTAGDGIGGGVKNSGDFWATNCTLWDNGSFGGISTNTYSWYNGTNGSGFEGTLSTTGGTLFLMNTILGNSGSTSNCLGGILDGGYNLCSDNSCAFTSTGSLNNTEPMLGLLANNGGFGRTFALLNGSPAFDGGSPTTYPPTDQRGILRPQGARSDIGAVEQSFTVYMTNAVGALQISCQGSSGASYILQESLALPTWTSIATNSATNGIVVFSVGTPLPSTAFFRIKTAQ